MIETRTVQQRLDDLEHDNNMLRTLLADVQRENARMRSDWEDTSKRITKLIATVNEFVGRFGVVQ